MNLKAKKNAQQSFFTNALLSWYREDRRPLPWKAQKNPYQIWLSEIILQQTRVSQGLPYYNRFIRKYPDVQALANAPEDEVMKLWEGLGYYTRAKNMMATAKQLAFQQDGKFPEDYHSLLQLKGVGPYTAAAIASFAFGKNHAVVDGNVFRVLSRFFGIPMPIDTSEGKKRFTTLAQKLIDPADPGKYNQAIMDFGALQCTPHNPDCTNCPMQSGCVAYARQTIESLPVKSKKTLKRERFFCFLIFIQNGTVLIEKRKEKDIWKNLYTFPSLELDQADFSFERITESVLWNKIVSDHSFALNKISKPFRQTLTHQIINGTFFEIELIDHSPNIKSPLISVEQENLRKFAFPKIIDWYLRDNSLYLNLR